MPLVGGIVKAGPSAPRFVLGVGGEEVGATADAIVYAVFLMGIELAREGPLRTLLPSNSVLLGRQPLLPLFFVLLDFIAHIIVVLVV